MLLLNDTCLDRLTEIYTLKNLPLNGPKHTLYAKFLHCDLAKMSNTFYCNSQCEILLKNWPLWWRFWLEKINTQAFKFKILWTITKKQLQVNFSLMATLKSSILLFISFKSKCCTVMLHYSPSLLLNEITLTLLPMI